MRQGPQSPSTSIEVDLIGANARKDAALTRVELTDTLGIAQPQSSSYEVDGRRVPVALLPGLTRALPVTIAELIGE